MKINSYINLSDWKPQTPDSTASEIDQILHDAADPTLVQSIFLTGCRLDHLPKSVRRFGGLEKLDISFNELVRVDVMGLGLVVLDATRNRVQRVESMCCGSLKTLLVCRNQIAMIERLDLPALVHIDLSHNLICEFPDDFFGALPMLTRFNASYNDIGALPLNLGSTLKSLIVSNNKIKTLPQSLNKLSNLKLIDVSANSIQTLEESAFDYLHNLTKVLLNKNPLTNLPDLSDLLSLQVLDLSDTLLKVLPISLAKLAHLTTLYVVTPSKDVANPLKVGREEEYGRFVFPPAEVVKQGFAAIIPFLRNANSDSLVTEAVERTFTYLDELEANLEELRMWGGDGETVVGLLEITLNGVCDSFRTFVVATFVPTVVSHTLLLPKFTSRLGKIFDRLETVPNFSSILIENIIYHIESVLFNALLSRPLVTEKSIAGVRERVDVWALYIWERVSMQTMNQVQELLVYGTGNLKVTTLSKRQIERWVKNFGGIEGGSDGIDGGVLYRGTILGFDSFRPSFQNIVDS